MLSVAQLAPLDQFHTASETSSIPWFVPRSSRFSRGVEGDCETYLRPEMCEYPEHGCPHTLGSRIGAGRQVDEASDRGGANELQEPNGAFHAGPANGRQRAGFLCDLLLDDRAVEIARLLPEPEMREKVPGNVSDFLLGSF